MRIIHFSDIHACAAPDSFSTFFDKRIVGFFNYSFRRRFQHRLDFLDRMVSFILKEEPDVVICTGDLTSTSQPAEFEIVTNILKPIIRHKTVNFFCVPGNHDVYVRNKRCMHALYESFKTINSEALGVEGMPHIIKLQKVQLILCNECVPTNIFLSIGKLRDGSVNKIMDSLREERELINIFIGHFPLRYQYGVGGFRHRMYGGRKIVELLDSRKIALSLCGHIHSGYADVDQGGYGEICAGSLTRFGKFVDIYFDESSHKFKHTFRTV